jgi:hypothetical protein
MTRLIPAVADIGIVAGVLAVGTAVVGVFVAGETVVRESGLDHSA